MNTVKLMKLVIRMTIAALVLAGLAASATAPGTKVGFDGPVPACWPLCKG